MTNRNSPKRAEGAQGSFDCRREAPGGSGAGAQFLPTQNPNWSSHMPPLPDRSTLVPTGGRRSLACASLHADQLYALSLGSAQRCRPEVGVVLPTRHLVWAAVSHARKKLTAANFVRCRRDRGESVKGGLPPPFHKSTTTNRNSPKRAEGAQGSFDSGAKRRAVRERGLNSFPLKTRTGPAICPRSRTARPWCRPEVGVPLPARRSTRISYTRSRWAPPSGADRRSALSCLRATLCGRRLAKRAKTDGSELRSLPA